MYERMLDKQHQPTMEQFAAHCGAREKLFAQLNRYLSEIPGTESLLRFPYGNSYGWGVKYFIKSRHICDVFAEKDAFTVMLRLTDAQFEKIYNSVTAYTKEHIDNKYPCGTGGWIHYRVLTAEHLSDAEKLLSLKASRQHLL